MGFHLPRNTILNVLLCGLLGATLVSQGSRLLAVISIAVILSILFRNVSESLWIRRATLKALNWLANFIRSSNRFAEFVIEEQMKEQEKMLEQAELDARAQLMFSPDTEYNERFEAVMVDLLNGRHPVQLEGGDAPELKNPKDNTEDEENPTSEF